eukprot:GHVU01048257.1.p3 GENE.GHVU01048257.1~~GHVU01048257.1.p3  ORF type:complete len:126 (+),score=8.35 GHVU01048257.1:543-920(+)
MSAAPASGWLSALCMYAVTAHTRRLTRPHTHTNTGTCIHADKRIPTDTQHTHKHIPTHIHTHTHAPIHTKTCTDMRTGGTRAHACEPPSSVTRSAPPGGCANLPLFGAVHTPASSPATGGGCGSE